MAYAKSRDRQVFNTFRVLAFTRVCARELWGPHEAGQGWETSKSQRVNASV